MDTWLPYDGMTRNTMKSASFACPAVVEQHVGGVHVVVDHSAIGELVEVYQVLRHVSGNPHPHSRTSNDKIFRKASDHDLAATVNKVFSPVALNSIWINQISIYSY